MDNTRIKPLMTSEEIIEHMEKKGIKFQLMTKDDALKFLLSNNNYFKLTSYRKNFAKYAIGDKLGCYIDLDFAYLRDLSIIDMHLRHILLKMTLDIEHYIKVNLLKHMESNPDEDGYSTVADFIKTYDDNNNIVISDIVKNAGSPYCGELLFKYNIDKSSKTIENFPIWAFVEVISFGRLKDFYNFYYANLGLKDKYDLGFLLTTVNQLRNAVAHNNCLINNLYPVHPDCLKYYKPNFNVMTFLSNAGVSNTARTNKMRNPRLRQIASTIYVFDSIVTSKAIKQNRYYELNKLVEDRMLLREHYYDKNETILSAFDFIKKITKYGIKRIDEESV